MLSGKARNLNAYRIANTRYPGHPWLNTHVVTHILIWRVLALNLRSESVLQSSNKNVAGTLRLIEEIGQEDEKRQNFVGDLRSDRGSKGSTLSDNQNK